MDGLRLRGRRFGGLDLRLGLPFLLRLLEILYGGAEGTFQLRALLGHEGEQMKVFLVEFNF
jgi:hypothetical protein